MRGAWREFCQVAGPCSVKVASVAFGDSPYRSGRAACWLKVKNPVAHAVTRAAEEEWN
jgi:hypothetical protein